MDPILYSDKRLGLPPRRHETRIAELEAEVKGLRAEAAGDRERFKSIVAELREDCWCGDHDRCPTCTSRYIAKGALGAVETPISP